ncbi:MAG: DUF3108 domain-containing protein [Chitinophagaceae bacterium]
MRIFALVVAFFIFGNVSYVVAQEDFCNTRNKAFEDGEQLYYKVWYNLGKVWIGAGEANLTVTGDVLNGKKMYHIVGDGKTLKTYDFFYRVRDRYESWVDATTMQPAKFLRNVNEGGYRIYNNVIFNQNIGTAVSTTGIFQVPKCVQDVLSAIYFARNINFNACKFGAKIPFSMFLDDKVYSLYIRILGRERIDTRYGTFNVIKIAPLLIEGNSFSGGEKMIVYVSDDENHIPVRIESPIAVGSVKVDLMGYQNLRNPLTGLLWKK